MKYIDEYRDANAARKLARSISQAATREWTIMEICGGQTHSIVKYGVDALLPASLTLVHGPGCPVCVTPAELIDKAIEIALLPNAILCSFGDMLRVPGTSSDLLAARASGGDVRVVYSPLDALVIAGGNPGREVVFFGVGFETTAPATAMAVYRARRDGLTNFSLLASHVLVPPAMEAILGSPQNCVQGFLAAGHVCTVMGYAEYEPIAKKYSVPIVVTGFEPVDILEGILMCVLQLESGRCEVENQYVRSVRPEGNRTAQELMGAVFRVVDRRWRGIGDIGRSGFGLSNAYTEFDAERKFGAVAFADERATECIAGLILQGIRKPVDCAAFGSNCTPERPLGAPMVSSEGACAAYYRYRRADAPGL